MCQGLTKTRKWKIRQIYALYMVFSDFLVHLRMRKWGLFYRTAKKVIQVQLDNNISCSFVGETSALMFTHKSFSSHLLFAIGLLLLSGGAFIYSAMREPAFINADDEPENCIYHWKTVYNPSAWELDFLERHDIKRMYVRMFDVDRTYRGPEPIATTKFRQTLPEGVEFVPTVYVTNEAMAWMGMSDEDAEKYAGLIVKRLKSMANHNKLGRFKEVQIDCDWSKQTREAYFELLSQMRKMLDADDISLSVTLRLHQLRDAAPPVDRVTLMLYNTGALMNAKTENSILNIADVEPYLRKRAVYSKPMDFAHPVFRWGVMFRDNQFERLVSNPDAYKDSVNMRIEESRMSDILATKQLIAEKLYATRGNNIIYHLDSLQLSRFSDNDIRQILARP